MFSYFLQPFFSHRSAFVLPLFCRNAYQTRAVCGLYVTFSRIPPVSGPHTACEMEGDGEKVVPSNLGHLSRQTDYSAVLPCVNLSSGIKNLLFFNYVCLIVVS